MLLFSIYREAVKFHGQRAEAGLIFSETDLPGMYRPCNITLSALCSIELNKCKLSEANSIKPKQPTSLLKTV